MFCQSIKLQFSNSNLNPLTKFTGSSRSTKFKDDHEDRPNQQANSHELYDETGHPMQILWNVNGN